MTQMEGIGTAKHQKHDLIHWVEVKGHKSPRIEQLTHHHYWPEPHCTEHWCHILWYRKRDKQRRMALHLKQANMFYVHFLIHIWCFDILLFAVLCYARSCFEIMWNKIFWHFYHQCETLLPSVLFSRAVILASKFTSAASRSAKRNQSCACLYWNCFSQIATWINYDGPFVP